MAKNSPWIPLLDAKADLTSLPSYFGLNSPIAALQSHFLTGGMELTKQQIEPKPKAIDSRKSKDRNPRFTGNLAGFQLLPTLTTLPTEETLLLQEILTCQGNEKNKCDTSQERKNKRGACAYQVKIQVFGPILKPVFMISSYNSHGARFTAAIPHRGIHFEIKAEISDMRKKRMTPTEIYSYLVEKNPEVQVCSHFLFFKRCRFQKDKFQTLSPTKSGLTGIIEPTLKGLKIFSRNTFRKELLFIPKIQS